MWYFHASKDNPSQSQLKMRVKKGAWWLDKEYPGWEKRIRIYELCMFDTSSCILGQLYGNMYDKTEEMGWGDFECYMLGFDVWSSPSEPLGRLLKELWIEEINTRCLVAV